MAIEQLSDAPTTTPVPTYDTLMWPTLQALKAMGGSASNEELLNRVIEVAGIPPAVQAIKHKDQRRPRLDYNLAWAKSFLKKVGAIDNSSRGVWSITKKGEGLTEEDVKLVPSQAQKLWRTDKVLKTDTEVEVGDVERATQRRRLGKTNCLTCFAT